MKYIIEAIMMCEVLSGMYGNDLFLIAFNLGVSIKVGKYPSALKVFSDLVLIVPPLHLYLRTKLNKIVSDNDLQIYVSIDACHVIALRSYSIYRAFHALFTT